MYHTVHTLWESSCPIPRRPDGPVWGSVRSSGLFVVADFSLRGRLRRGVGFAVDCRAAQPARPDLLDILDLLDFVFDFFYGSKSGVEIEDHYPGGGGWPLAGFWRYPSRRRRGADPPGDK